MKHPFLPLLEGPNGSRYPPEVCDIRPDQGFKGELTDRKHVSAMVDVACKPPKENANEIVNRGIGMLGFRDSTPVLDSFGISVGTEMAVVPGRVLDRPGLSYSSGKSATIDGRASWNLRDVKFAVGARLDKWAVLVIQDGGRSDFKDVKDPELRRITNGFRMMCNDSGMEVQPLREQAYAVVRLSPLGNNRFREDAIGEIEQAMRGLMERAAPELVLVMLSNEDKAIYNGLKWLCDVKLDIATVCMQSEKVRKDRGQPQYFANVALKANMKMGGINHKLDANSGTWLKSAPTMIMGMDVTHATGGGPTNETRKHFYTCSCKHDLTGTFPISIHCGGSREHRRTLCAISHNTCPAQEQGRGIETPNLTAGHHLTVARSRSSVMKTASSGTCSSVVSSYTGRTTRGNYPSELFYTAMGSPRYVYPFCGLICPLVHESSRRVSSCKYAHTS